MNLYARVRKLEQRAGIGDPAAVRGWPTLAEFLEARRTGTRLILSDEMRGKVEARRAQAIEAMELFA